MTFGNIQSRTFDLVQTNDTNYTDAALSRAVNEAIRRVGSLILRHDRRWQYDDSNNTDLPVATTTITSAQQDYALATAHLSIDRVELKDSSGRWRRLVPFDQQDIKRNATSPNYGTSGLISGFNQNTALAVGETTRTGAYQEANGIPKEYDLIGSSVFLYPTPNFTQAASLKVYFTREPKMFDYSDDKFEDDTGSAASVPGFNSLFHDLIPLWAAYDYAISVGKQNGNQLMTEIIRKEQELIDSYGQRDRDTRGGFSISRDSNK